MKLRKNPSKLSINSQASTSSVSSMASATRKFIRTLTPFHLRHAQSMSAVRQSQSTITRADIGAPLVHTAVDLARGRYLQDHRLGILQLPYPPIQIQSHWKPAGECREDPTSVFEPRPTNNDADVAKETIFEPRFVPEDGSPSCIPVPVGSPQYRQRSVTLVSKSSHQRPSNSEIPRTGKTYPPRRRNNVLSREDSLNIPSPLSPVCEEHFGSRHENCLAFPAFDDLVTEAQKLESG